MTKGTERIVRRPFHFQHSNVILTALQTKLKGVRNGTDGVIHSL